MTFYQFARGIVLSLFKVVFRVRVVGRERVPNEGAYIVAPSHRSILDIPFAAFITAVALYWALCLVVEAGVNVLRRLADARR